MAIDLKKCEESFEKALKHLSQEDFERYFPKKDIPKGWVDIEKHLPGWMIDDVGKGFSVYKVKDINGKEFESKVTDHQSWYYKAKEAGVTHWWNG